MWWMPYSGGRRLGPGAVTGIAATVFTVAALLVSAVVVLPKVLNDSDGRVKLRSFDWEAIPGLFRTARRTLGVPKPTRRYLIVDPAWVFANDQPVVLVYLTDAYGGAYLAASMSGKVLKKVPRSS